MCFNACYGNCSKEYQTSIPTLRLQKNLKAGIQYMILTNWMIKPMLVIIKQAVYARKKNIQSEQITVSYNRE